VPQAPAVSYPLATWVSPLVPMLAVLGLVALGSGLDEGSSGYAGGLGVCALLLLVGVAARAVLPGRHLKGLGLGLAVGAAVTGVAFLVALVA